LVSRLFQCRSPAAARLAPWPFDRAPAPTARQRQSGRLVRQCESTPSRVVSTLTQAGVETELALIDRGIFCVSVTLRKSRRSGGRAGVGCGRLCAGGDMASMNSVSRRRALKKAVAALGASAAAGLLGESARRRRPGRGRRRRRFSRGLRPDGSSGPS
jgi:hypothetical protein